MSDNNGNSELVSECLLCTETFSRICSFHNNPLRRREREHGPPILQMRKQRPREVGKCSSGYTARKSQNQDQNQPVWPKTLPCHHNQCHLGGHIRQTWSQNKLFVAAAGGRSPRTGQRPRLAAWRDGQGHELCPQSLSSSQLHRSRDHVWAGDLLPWVSVLHLQGMESDRARLRGQF